MEAQSEAYYLTKENINLVKKGGLMSEALLDKAMEGMSESDASQSHLPYGNKISRKQYEAEKNCCVSKFRVDVNIALYCLETQLGLRFDKKQLT